MYSDAVPLDCADSTMSMLEELLKWLSALVTMTPRAGRWYTDEWFPIHVWSNTGLVRNRIWGIIQRNIRMPPLWPGTHIAECPLCNVYFCSATISDSSSN